MLKEQIISQLKSKFPGVNLSKVRIDAIADKLAAKITEESEIDGKLDELNELFPFAEIAKQDDRLRTLEAKNKPVQQPQPQPEPSPAPSDDPVAKKLAEMEAKLQAFEREKQQAKLQETFTKKLSEKKIPAQLAKGRTIESEEQLEAVITEIESDYTALKQQLINDGLSTSSQPVAASASPATVDADIAAWAAKK